MEAESIVILAPMFQVGWARASFGVTNGSLSAGRFLNAPPEAVIITPFTLSRPMPSTSLQMAECSESTGRTRFPKREAASRTRRPAMTMVSLFASARSKPHARAFSETAKPSAPAAAFTKMSAGVDSMRVCRPRFPLWRILSDFGVAPLRHSAEPGWAVEHARSPASSLWADMPTIRNSPGCR